MNKKTIDLLLRWMLPPAMSVIGIVWGRHHRYELAWFFFVFSIGLTMYLAWVAYKNWPSQAQWRQNRSNAYGQVSIFLAVVLCGIYLTYLSLRLVLMEAA
ncbi:hypothetical protein ACSBOB_16690 [Mesorhizobium sp. ASY16-5R]|uniref:hypothetical protein n=1 Tax=Mesorhizobium sp. ASY16-5R TaxID=3445772 RepID=UPI003FA05F7B